MTDEPKTDPVAGAAAPDEGLFHHLADDTRKQFKKLWVLWFLILGLVLMIGGETALYLTEESVPEIVKATLHEEHARTEPTTSPAEGAGDVKREGLPAGARSVVRFSAEVLVKLGELLL